MRTFRLILIGLLVAVALSPAAAQQGARWYVRADADPDGDGTNNERRSASGEHAFDELADLVGVVGEADTIFLTGRFHERLELAGLSDVVVTRAPGASERPSIRGDVPIRKRDWWRSADGITFNFRDVTEPFAAGVVWNWDENVDAQGRHFGHLVQQSSIAQCRAAPGTWYWDAPRGRVYVHPPVGAAAPDQGDTYAWCRPEHGIKITRSDFVRVRDIDIGLWLDRRNGKGYGARFLNCSNCLLEDVLIEDCAYHSAGFVGNECSSNIFRRVECRGLSPDGATALVFFSDGDDITGCLAERCTAHLYTWLDSVGAPLPGDVFTDSRLAAATQHTASSTRIRDVEWREIEVIAYPGYSSYVIGVGDYVDPLPVHELKNPDAYAVRVYDSTVVGGNTIGSPQQIAYVRCSFDMPLAGTTGTLSVGEDSQMLLRSCTVSGSLYTGENARLVTLRDNAQLTLQNVTLLARGAHADSSYLWLADDADFASIDAEQTVFASDGPIAMFANDRQLDWQNAWSFEGCWYPDVITGRYSDHPAVNRRVEWMALVDSSGVYGVPALFEDMTQLVPRSGSPLAIRVARVSDSRPHGINLLPYSGHYGAHQNGCLADFDGSGQVDTADFLAFLRAFVREDTTADLSRNGTVETSDFLAFLNAFLLECDQKDVQPAEAQ